MDWTSLFASLDLNNLIPQCYAKWKPFVSEGLAWFLSQLSEERQQKILADQIELGPFATAASRLELILRRCPTLHKLGQVLARDKRLDADLRKSLQKLEMLEPEYTSEMVKALLIEEGIDITRIELAQKPLAEASVAVVTAFTFNDENGKKIDGVFKIIRPEAEKALQEELALWPGLGRALELISDRLNLPRPELAGPLSDAAQLVADEVRLEHEQANLKRAKELYKNISEIEVPELLPWCSNRVTAMSLVKGKKLSEALSSDAKERRIIAEKLVDGMIAKPFWMAETWAIFHGDPHGGNIFLNEEGKIVPLDWSLSVELPKNERVSLLQLLLSGMKLDASAVTQALSQLGIATDRQKLKEVGIWAVSRIRDGVFPGFDWCLAVLDRAMEYGGLGLRAELALFRKALFSLLALVEDIAPEAVSDSVVAGAGLAKLAQEWPYRAFANPFSREWDTHVSTAELMNLFASLPMTATRFWLGSWQDSLKRVSEKESNA
ncbi:MAG: ubiquinone biosynthesis protein [Clostridiales bacterium]|jgi:ubiquinone biosynthesis protein|nr:ubiquinone biosynthesis protein [Clostridiales bacterium]MDN5282732.1 ubiquinone biosynthesis protein [Candidatus Ozemobacter sp.]